MPVRSFNMADGIRALFGDDRSAIANLDGARLISAGKVGDCVEIVSDKGTLRGTPEGDCCSQSWIENVECDAPHGALFVGLIDDDPELPVPEWHDGDERRVYFGTFITDKGRITWEMRNESNGYYGGWVNWTWEAA